MALIKFTILTIIAAAVLVARVESKGKLVVPLNRASLWRVNLSKDDVQTPVNEKDDENNCGGLTRQILNKGNCGPCGDDYSYYRPRPNENRGIYGGGYIVEQYNSSQTIQVTAEVADNFSGHFRLHLCKLQDDNDLESEECFDEHPLSFEDGSRDFYVGRFAGNYTARAVLPLDLTCDRCVLRWEYVSGNRKGMCDYNVVDYGCGEQETFRTCSDIRIVQ